MNGITYSYTLRAIDSTGTPEVLGTVNATPVGFNVQLSSLTAAGYDNLVVLMWTITLEMENDHFMINRDGVTVGTVSSEGNSSEPQNYSFADHTVLNGITYHYVLLGVDVSGYSHPLGNVSATPQNPDAVDEHLLMPQSFSLSSYPNPFNPSTTIVFSLNHSEKVNLAIFDIAGRQVSTLSDEFLLAGQHEFLFNGTDLPSGIYFAHLQTPTFTQNQKLILLK